MTTSLSGQLSGSCGPPDYVPPPPRESPERVGELVTRLAADPTLRLLLESLPVPTLVLNRSRQILGGNERARALVEGTGIVRAEGRRPGEALGCTEPPHGPDGCGTAPACADCGAGRSLSDVGRDGRRPVVRECRVATGPDGPGAFDLEVQASALEIDGEAVLLLTLRDISAEKRREVLERVFFHDVLNTAGGVQGLAEVLTFEGIVEAERRELTGSLREAVGRLVEEIVHQRRLLAAERGDLECDLGSIDAADLLGEVRRVYARHPVAGRRRIETHAAPGLVLVSDRALLFRSLGNLVKNALEAVEDGETVTVTASDDGDRVRFTVANPGEIPAAARAGIFRRSFSTKGEKGRGIGTWSVRLFVTRWLGGEVGFESDAAAGTRFTISLPRSAG